jgi:hypothetical protein
VKLRLYGSHRRKVLCRVGGLRAWAVEPKDEVTDCALQQRSSSFNRIKSPSVALDELDQRPDFIRSTTPLLRMRRRDVVISAPGWCAGDALLYPQPLISAQQCIRSGAGTPDCRLIWDTAAITDPKRPGAILRGWDWRRDVSVAAHRQYCGHGFLQPKLSVSIFRRIDLACA